MQSDVDWREKRQRFLTNPGINPYTGRAITIGGPKYQELVREFGHPPGVTVPPKSGYNRGYPLTQSTQLSQLSQLNQSPLSSQSTQIPSIRPVSVPRPGVPLTRVPVIGISTQTTKPTNLQPTSRPIRVMPTPIQIVGNVVQPPSTIGNVGISTIRILPPNPKTRPNRDMLLAKWGAIRNSSPDIIHSDVGYTTRSQPNLSWRDSDIMQVWTNNDGLSPDIIDYIVNEYQRLYSTL